jgi:hypothetical protein
MFKFLFSIICSMAVADATEATAETQPRLPALPNQEAWKRLPDAPAAVQPLPVWARIMAKQLPVTTARMLELDAMHRTGDRLDARLRGVTRWAAADANKCKYSRAVAAADLRRAGVTDRDLDILAKSPEQLPLIERLSVAFARKMMQEAHAVTDSEFKRLLEVAGEERTVALVALLSHASFQDHIFLALNIQEEPSGDLPPLMVKFGRPKPPMGAHSTPPEIVPPKERLAASSEWLRFQDSLDKQRARSGRIRVPSHEEVLKRLGGEQHPAAWQSGILWSRVCYGYQPELTDAWFDVSGAFRTESNFDPVFTNSVFWVVTESLQCFY